MIFRPGLAQVIQTNLAVRSTYSHYAPWWLAGGIPAANCKLAYQPVGAVDLAGSYINLANPGTNNVAPGVAPIFSSGLGWGFNGSTQYLATSFAISSLNSTMIVKFAAASIAAFKAMCGAISSTAKRFYLAVEPTLRDYGNDGLRTVAGGIINGVTSVAGSQGYLNGTADGAAIATFVNFCNANILVGAENNNGTPSDFWPGTIIALAVYDIVLSAAQETAVTNSMNQACQAAAIRVSGYQLNSSQLLYSGSGSTDWLGRPVLLDDGSKWIMIYRQGSAHLYDTGSSIHIRFSTDQGVTWTAADTYTNSSAVTGAPFVEHSTNAVADPVIFQAPNGDLLLHVAEHTSADVAAGTWQYRSTNGGASWTDEGQINSDADIFGGQDYVVVGSDMYITTVSSAWASPIGAKLYKSTNNGTTWTFISDIITTTDNGNEAGIIYTGGTTLLAVIRDTNNAKTYSRISTNMGTSWGTLTDITSQLRVFQRPRMRIFSSEPNRIYLFGRESLVSGYTVMYWSDDSGSTWSAGFYPGAIPYVDTGYCDILKRTDDTYYMLSYGGTLLAASIYEYIFKKI